MSPKNKLFYKIKNKVHSGNNKLYSLVKTKLANSHYVNMSLDKKK